MPRKVSPRLSEALVRYERIRSATCAKTTVQNDHSVLGRFIRGVGDPQCHLLTAEACEDWFASEAGRQLPTSFNKIRTRTLGFLEFCRRRGWLDSDPMLQVTKRRTQARRPRLQLTENQLVDLIELTENPRDRCMLAAGANTGLRTSDLEALVIGDVDLDQGVINLIVQKTQTADSLPITSDLDTELRRWLTWYLERLARMGIPVAPDMYLFCALNPCNSTRDGAGRPLKYGNPKPYVRQTNTARVVHRALERIGITEVTGEGFHMLRRSVGRLVFERASAEGHDSSLRITAALLGHKNVATTELYLGISRDREKRDALLKGRTFLSGADRSNVRTLPQAN